MPERLTHGPDLGMPISGEFVDKGCRGKTANSAYTRASLEVVVVESF